MYVVVSYDIVSDKARRRVAKMMEGFGSRVQWSVFDCTLDEPALQRMRKRLLRLINPERDSVRIYRICERCRHNIDILGCGAVREEESLIIV